MSDKTLYKITEDLREFNEMLEQSEGELTEENEAFYEKVSAEFISKADSCAFRMDQLQDELTIAKSRLDEISAYKKTIENKLESFKDYVRICLQMAGKKEFQGATRTIKIMKPRQVVKITDENSIDIEFLTSKQVISVNKKDILTALKEGREIKGACLTDSKPGVKVGGLK